jgi:arylsulfatase
MRILISTILLLYITSCQESNEKQTSKSKPNILLIVADDMGYADLGCFGSDILTPNIDQLAAEGVRFTNFYSAPSCAPTRASLLTGADNHMAGMGSQFNRTGDQWGYEGFLSDRVITIPQVLSDHGYHTSMVGKWHLGGKEDQLAQSKGFQRSFILHQGGGNHYNNIGFESTDLPSIYSLNGQEIEWPKDAYSTDLYTDYLIDFISESNKENKPFFALGAYTSPHWPLQVDSAYWTKYEADYVDGYESLRIRRLAALKAKGIISQDHPMPPLHPGITPWDSLSSEEQKIETRKMALYAGMLENLDVNVGRIIAHLKGIGEYDNTVIIFMSDNGAAYRDFYSIGPFKEFLQANYDNGYDNMGKASSFVSYGPGWAEAGSAPFRFYKQYTFEGGIRVPMIIRDPSTQSAGSINKSFATLTDIAPTFYELAQAPFPKKHLGNDIYPLQGKSILPLIRGEVNEIHGEDDAWTMEHHHHVLVRKGEWKLINTGMGWEESKFGLYNIATDPSESTDVKENHPEKYQGLLSVWKKFKHEYKVTAYDAGDE